MFSESDLQGARTAIEQLSRRATELVRQSRTAQAAMSATGAEAGNAHVRISVGGTGRVESLEFTAAASGAALSELSRSVMQAYRQAAARANRATAAAVSAELGDAGITTAVEESVPEDVAAERGEEEGKP